MFDTLHKQINGTQGKPPTSIERLARYGVVFLLTVIVFGGLFLGVWLLE